MIRLRRTVFAVFCLRASHRWLGRVLGALLVLLALALAGAAMPPSRAGGMLKLNRAPMWNTALPVLRDILSIRPELPIGARHVTIRMPAVGLPSPLLQPG